MEIEEIESFLKKCSEIQNKYEKELEEEGTYFNIFSILGLSSKEVRLHSTFIAELLNPYGRHSLQDLFLNKFTELLKKKFKGNQKLQKFNSDSNVKVEVEYSIGLISDDYDEGGRIDIMLTDKNKNRIIIENKIYAKDQYKQLERYYNFDTNAFLLYLTLDGKKSSENIKNKSISYKYFILKWLKECLKLLNKIQIKDSKKSKISETISQYRDIINNYLIPSNQNKMTEQIKNLLKKNEDIFKAIPEINSVHQSFIQEVRSVFWEEIYQKNPWREKIFTFKDGTVIKSEIYDEDGFYYGFLFENEIKKLNNELVISAFEYIKNARFEILNDKIWIYGIPKVDFNDLDWVYKMSDEKVREKFITEEIFPDFKYAKETIIKVANELNQ